MNLILCILSGTGAANWTHLKLWSHMVGLSQAQNVELVKVLWILTAVSPHAAIPRAQLLACAYTTSMTRDRYLRMPLNLRDSRFWVSAIGPCPTPELSQRSAEHYRVVCSATASLRQQGFVCLAKCVIWFKAYCLQKSHCDIKGVFQTSTHHI